MKRKYAAIALGMALSLSVTGAGAASVVSAAQESTSEETTDSAKKSEESTEEEKSDGEKPDGEAPEKPDGEAPTGEKPDGEPPEKPEGETTDGKAPSGEKSDGEPPEGAPGNGQGGAPGGQAQQPENYAAVKEYTGDTVVDGETISSTGTDENAVHVSGGNVQINGASIDRASEDSEGGDTSSFYGVGAAVLGTGGTTYVNGGTVTTDAAGAAGIFAYGDGTVYASGTSISTQKDTSGGIHAAGGGTLYAWDMNVETNGESSAAIRSDRGGGKMVVDGGTYTSNGVGSPAIYSTADIAVSSAELTANGSEAVCIEGANSLHLYDSNLTGNMSDLDQNDCTWNVILYQSMSGDSEEGNSTFEMNGGTLTAKNGGMFYTTNTESTISLSGVDITNAEDSKFFLKCTGNSNERGWGEAGANGADCLFTAENQEMEGDVVWDSISQLDFYVTDGSTLAGAVIDDESNAGEGGDGYCNLIIDEGSTWTVTGDSTLTSLSSEGTITDTDGKTVTIKGTDGTVYVEGESSYTITVENYSDSADLSGASQTTQWSDYETEKPEELTE